MRHRDNLVVLLPYAGTDPEAEADRLMDAMLYHRDTQKAHGLMIVQPGAAGELWHARCKALNQACLALVSKAVVQGKGILLTVNADNQVQAELKAKP